MPTISEVAKKAGVSPATVSRSFTDSTLLTQATRERVLEVASALNYQPPRTRSANKRSSLVKSTEQPAEAERTVGFQFFAPSDTATIQSDAFYAPLLSGALAEVQKLGLRLVVHTTNRYLRSFELPRETLEQEIAGMLLVGTADPHVLSAFLQHVPQIILVNNRDATRRHDCILSDGIGGATEATNYLFSLGHRRISFVMKDVETATFQDRLTGYVNAHFRAGIAVDPRLVVAATSAEAFAEQATALMGGKDRPTAIVAANDPHAYRVIQLCHALGLRVPQDISIIGFDDDQFSNLSSPPLTTMKVDTEYLGRLAVRRLFARLQESAMSALPEPSINIELPVSLVIRSSCGPPCKQ